jgi:hypothetical protein
MCFSATASFAASGVLAAASVATLTTYKKTPNKLFAFIPLVFALQQAFEGFQWLALDHGAGSAFWGYAFLFFAYLFWPIFFPLAALQIEKDPTRRVLIYIFEACGVFAATMLGYMLLTQPLVVTQFQHSVNYGMQVPLYDVVAACYVLAVCGSGLVVRRPWIVAMAVLCFIGLVVSYVLYTTTFGSVWCFFAAILSVCIIMDLQSDLRKKKK